MGTKTKLAVGALLAFNIVSSVASFDDQYDTYSDFTPHPSVCLGRRASEVVGGQMAGDFAGASVRIGSTILGLPGSIVGGIAGRVMYSVKKDREGPFKETILEEGKAYNYCPPSIFQSKAFSRQ